MGTAVDIRERPVRAVDERSGADDPSKDTPLRVGGWHDGEEGTTLGFDGLKIGEWQTLASGNQFRWDDANGHYTYKVVSDSNSWKTLYDSVTHTDISQLNIKADGLEDNSPVNNTNNTTGILNENRDMPGLGLGVRENGSTDDPERTIDFIRNLFGKVEEQSLIVDLGGKHGAIKLGLAPNMASGYEEHDQFVLDLYDQNGNLIGTDDNSGQFFLIKDFTSNAVRFFQVNGQPVVASHVGIRAMPTEKQWADP